MMNAQSISSEQRDAAIRSFGDQANCWSILVTATDSGLQDWADAICAEVFDWREQTCRMRLWYRNDQRDRVLDRAIEAARKYDCTLQLLCVYEPIEETAEHYELGGGAHATVREMREEYPVLHLGSHGMKWGS